MIDHSLLHPTMDDGAVKIDMVVNTGKVLSDDWEYVRNEMAAVVASTKKHGTALKVIFENDFLPVDQHKIRLCKSAASLKLSL